MKPEVDRGHVLCATYWGTHGCSLIRGHEGDCKCECCECVDHQADPQDGCVGSAPYYGPETRFYGEDADWVTDETMSREETLARSEALNPAASDDEVLAIAREAAQRWRGVLEILAKR